MRRIAGAFKDEVIAAGAEDREGSRSYEAIGVDILPTEGHEHTALMIGADVAVIDLAER